MYAKAFTETDRIVISAAEHQLPYLIPPDFAIQLFAKKADGTADVRVPLDHERREVHCDETGTLIIYLHTPRSGVVQVRPSSARPHVER